MQDEKSWYKQKATFRVTPTIVGSFQSRKRIALRSSVCDSHWAFDYLAALVFFYSCDVVKLDLTGVI